MTTMTVSGPTASSATSANAGWGLAAVERQAVVVSLRLQKYLLAVPCHAVLRYMVQLSLPCLRYCTGWHAAIV